ncbi:MAG: alginate lyase family protein [Verrucomicrobiota bacterium]
MRDPLLQKPWAVPPFVVLLGWFCLLLHPGPAGAAAPATTNAAAGDGARSFRHPGLINSRAELDRVKAGIQSGEEPWASAFNRLKNSGYGKPSWTPRPLAVVHANGREAEIENEDAKAAYAQALLWYFTGNEAYARKSAEILDAWSGVLTNHVSTDQQHALVAAWCGSVFPLAAEILRSSYPGWTTNETKQFSAMLNRAFLPLIFPGNAAINGNWELSMSDALMCIGVFNEDAAAFDRGVFLWRKRVPAYFYLSSDGPTPVRPYGTRKLDSDAALFDYWYKPARYFDGLCQETRRDYGHHMQMGLASAINAAEIAYHQGLDLYSENDRRFVEAMEFQAGALIGKPVPGAYFPDGFVASDVLPTWEIAYNHFHNRKGFGLPSVEVLILTKVRNSDFTAMCNLAWESLTHAEVDGKGR